MRLEVAFDKMRRSRFIHNDGEIIFVYFVVLVEFDGRKPQALGGDMGAKGLPTCRAPAEVHPVSATDGEAQQGTFKKDWHREGDVVDMGAAPKRIVERNHVPRGEAFYRKSLNRPA